MTRCYVPVNSYQIYVDVQQLAACDKKTNIFADYLFLPGIYRYTSIILLVTVFFLCTSHHLSMHISFTYENHCERKCKDRLGLRIHALNGPFLWPEWWYISHSSASNALEGWRLIIFGAPRHEELNITQQA